MSYPQYKYIVLACLYPEQVPKHCYLKPFHLDTHNLEIAEYTSTSTLDRTKLNACKLPVDWSYWLIVRYDLMKKLKTDFHQTITFCTMI
jgi:hypothetical protein